MRKVKRQITLLTLLFLKGCTNLTSSSFSALYRVLHVLGSYRYLTSMKKLCSLERFLILYAVLHVIEFYRNQRLSFNTLWKKISWISVSAHCKSSHDVFINVRILYIDLRSAVRSTLLLPLLMTAFYMCFDI